jgi:hypothetical protein
MRAHCQGSPEQEVFLYPIQQFGVHPVVFMHLVYQVFDTLLKKKGSSMVQAAVQVLACFSHLLAVRALAVQNVLDVGHSGSCGANANALFGMPYLEHVRLGSQGSVDRFPRDLIKLVLHPS